MTPLDAATLAQGLTKASKRALVKIEPYGWTDEGSPGPSRTDAYSLWWGKDRGKGITDKPIPFQIGKSAIPSWRWRLTPLGRRVRASLLSDHREG